MEYIRKKMKLSKAKRKKAKLRKKEIIKGKRTKVMSKRKPKINNFLRSQFNNLTLIDNNFKEILK